MALNIAVFGDTHGHLRLMFQLCRLWQLEHGVHLDGILQCGDLGFFPNIWTVDKATRRYAKRDPEELGFGRFLRWPEPVEHDELLERTLTGPEDDLNTVWCPVIWCHGNHEDFVELSKIVGSADLVPVDAFERLYWLRSGCVTDLAGIRVAAIGGGPEPIGESYRDSRREPWNHVSRRACDLLMGESFDVLVTHCSPQGGADDVGRYGSANLRAVDEARQPSYHFYAHHTNPVLPCVIGNTRCYWLNDVNFARSRRGFGYAHLEPGCMGLLQWRGADDHAFAVVDEAWMTRVTWDSWRSL